MELVGSFVAQNIECNISRHEDRYMFVFFKNGKKCKTEYHDVLVEGILTSMGYVMFLLDHKCPDKITWNDAP